MNKFILRYCRESMELCIVEGCKRKPILEGYCFQHFKTVRKFDLYKRDVKKQKRNLWSSMLQRCNNPKNIAYKWYGGRGIRVCKEWHKYDNFHKDMGDRPEGYQLDRIDNDGDYKLSNCRWVTARDNIRNSRVAFLYPEIVIEIRKMKRNAIARKTWKEL